jgi:DNA-binding transcriptional LysR family regulator
MDRLRCIQVFVEVARDGSFTGAARRLGISKAGVTKHVAWLEHALRARLLHRTTKQVGLTEAGVSTLRSGKLLLNWSRPTRNETSVSSAEKINGQRGVR